MPDPGFAPAKVNLSLHVTGRRADGYHLLDSLVVFADLGDRVRALAADGCSLAIHGPMAKGVPADDSNLVLRAAQMLGRGRGAALVLEKHLPMASGIGGGSSDAAAALRVLAALWGLDLPEPAALLALGADVPVCLARAPVRMAGIGEVLHPVPPLPDGWLLLANPGCAVATPAIFRALVQRNNAPMPVVPRFGSAAELAQWLALQRNDLQAAASRLEPVIGQVLAGITAQAGCLIVRMSGSGATCFGLFAAAAQANAAAAALARTYPGWWVQAAAMLR